MNLNKNNDLKITYPGITVELIPGTQKFYEVVWNCGGLSVGLSALDDKNENKKSLEMVLNMLESVKKVNNQIIFITDSFIYQKQKHLIDALFKDIFGEENFRIVGIENISKEKNAISGLQINRTGFSDNNEIIKAIAELPNATVLSSIPKSDPRIDDINKEISDFRETIAGKTLQLLDLNSKKSNQIELAGEHIGYLGFAGNREELENIFEKSGEKTLVIKDDEGTAGGTSVNFVTKEQRNAVLENKNVNYPVVVYEFLEPTFINDLDGNKYPIQFRPFLNNDMELMGGALKFPSIPLGEKLFLNGNGKTSFEKQNKTLNTSSGLTNTILLGGNGEPIHSFVVGEKGFNSFNNKETEEFLNKFKLENSKKGLSLAEEVLELSEQAIPVLREMQERTNNLLKL